MRLATAIATAAFAVVPATAAAQSAEIAALQVALKAKGLYSGPVDGLAGPGTASGVRAVQSRAGIAVDGVSGPVTRQALGRLGRPPFGSRVLRAPAVGWDASMLQFLLATRGFPSGPFDGVLGARSTAAIVRFQGSRGLSADGIAGPATVRRGPRPRAALPDRDPPPRQRAADRSLRAARREVPHGRRLPRRQRHARVRGGVRLRALRR